MNISKSSAAIDQSPYPISALIGQLLVQLLSDSLHFVFFEYEQIDLKDIDQPSKNNISKIKNTSYTHVDYKRAARIFMTSRI